jgi:hypothetical protein
MEVTVVATYFRGGLHAEGDIEPRHIRTCDRQERQLELPSLLQFGGLAFVVGFEQAALNLLFLLPPLTLKGFV